MPDDKYISRHTGQEIDDAVDAVGTKADTISLGFGVKKILFAQMPLLALWKVEPQESCDSNNKLWYCTDGKLYYRKDGSISADGKDYDMGTPAYVIYYSGDKVYRWNGNGFTQIGGGDVINDLITGGVNIALSAEMGKVLDKIKPTIDDTTRAEFEIVDDDDNPILQIVGGHVITSNFNSSQLSSLYQVKLVSGTNIKTINNESILGQGNITISGGGGGTQVQSDWAESNTESMAYIRNKPTIPSVGAIAQNSTDAAQSGAVYTALSQKQGTISDIETIRSNSQKAIAGITTQQDGTIVLTLANGDTYTINLNHTHSQYVMVRVLTQVEYDALATKDSKTLYIIQ